MKIKTILQTVVEMPEFIRQSDSCMDEESKRSFISYIAEHPLDGDLIVGTGGVRKIRWTGDSNKGKRGGVRVIYYYYDQSIPIFLLTVYRKNQKDNLTQEEKHIVKSIIGKIVDAYKENGHE
ncbi:addiction module toxin RelE (plasmid) [Legionella longbeachae]|uniref:type II toxin-antitoxin system RelE/ParE family toxin n=1 Tax=Legionella longbeachae TaxID=450 RepID=UPI000A1C0538|nr:type II toxin-antitoxin system RelE/ParE family toxin [Legionella longbeachae]ARM35583.1 addiction module toxin RelE [Legionella longbeachae]